MNKQIFIISLMTLYPMACAAEPPVKPAITYDQIEKKGGGDFVLSTDLVIHETSRISTMTEYYFCENQTLEINLSRRFENKKRISVDLTVQKNGKKLNRLELSKASSDIEKYKFYDIGFNCMNGYFGVKITGYKFGLNGSRPSSQVFEYNVELESGKVLVNK